MFEVVAQLPAPNKDTLAFLILHLQDVASHAHNNKMPAESLAKIFGPTIVGHATPSPSNDVILDDTRKQAKVMEKLLSIRDESSKDGGYWNQFIPGGCAALSPGPGPSPRLALAPATPTPVTPTPGSAMSSPGMRSPATPELRPGQLWGHMHAHDMHVHVLYMCSNLHVNGIIVACWNISSLRYTPNLLQCLRAPSLVPASLPSLRASGDHSCPGRHYDG